MTAIDRFSGMVKWNGHKIPMTMEGLQGGGALTIATSQAVESIAPYTSPIVDDLFYESLFAADPSNETERMYALEANAVRLDADLKYVIFDLDPLARFHDDTLVRGNDVLYSAEVFRKSNSDNQAAYDAAVAKASATDYEVRFDLKTTGQATWHALMMLANIKIVKPNTSTPTSVGGISVQYTASGPYRLATLGKNQMGFVRQMNYWAAGHGSRNGLFNLDRIDVQNFEKPALARYALKRGKANFYFEPNHSIATTFWKDLSGANQDTRWRTEPPPKISTRKPALVFNLSRPLVQDLRVRRALMLAYDFEGIRQSYYKGQLQRPLHLGESSAIKPIALPNPEVAAVMKTCALQNEAFDDFTAYGHAQYAAITNNPARRGQAQKLLNEAGFILEGGILKKSGSPIVLRLYAPDLDPHAVLWYSADLSYLGIRVYVGKREENPNDFDLYASDLEFLSKDGHAFVEHLKLPESPYSPCLAGMLQTIHSESPNSEDYRIASEAFVRVSEALQMFIFTGEPSLRSYFIAERINGQTQTSSDNIYVHGYDNGQAEPPFGWILSQPVGQSCTNIQCVFGHMPYMR